MYADVRTKQYDILYRKSDITHTDIRTYRLEVHP